MGMDIEPTMHFKTFLRLILFQKYAKFIISYFWPFILQVVVSGQLNYSDPRVQDELEDLLSSLENTTYIDPIYTESW